MFLPSLAWRCSSGAAAGDSQEIGQLAPNGEVAFTVVGPLCVFPLADLDLCPSGTAYIRPQFKGAPVAQLDRAPAYEAGGYMFESCRAR